MPSVLFVCTANQFRSPLAAAIFEQALAEEEQARRSPWPIGKAVDWEVASAGLCAAPLQPVLPDVLEAGTHWGLDLSSHRSQRVQDLTLSDFDLILVMQESQKKALHLEFPGLRENIYLLSEVIEGSLYDFPDSYTCLHGILGVGDVMGEAIRRNMHYICVLAMANHNRRSRHRSVPEARVGQEADRLPEPAM